MNGKWITKLGMLFVLGLVAILAGCGGGGGGDGSAFVCTANGNMVLVDIADNPLTSLTFTATQDGSIPVAQSVFVAYNPDPAVGVAAVAAGYPVGTTDPRDYGLNIYKNGPNTDNPLEFVTFVFDTSLAPRTYNAVWRFIIADINENILGCQDLPVAYTITAP